MKTIRIRAGRERATAPLVSILLVCCAQAQTIHYVDVTCPSPAPPYLSWATAATNIQYAIDEANDGDIVLVTNGVYDTGGVAGYPTGSLLTNRVAIYKPLAVRAVSTNPADTVIVGHAPIGPGAMRGVYMVEGAFLANFTVRDAATLSSGDYTKQKSGGGIWAEGLGAVVSNCFVDGNSSDSSGGGVFRGTLSRCALRGNWSQDNVGGGASGSALYNCTIAGNWAADDGGGAYDCSLINCTLTGNAAGEGGGAYNCSLTNCTLTGNAAGGGAGAYGGTLNGCTLIENASINGGAASDAVLRNCVLIGNRSDDLGGGAWQSSLVGCLLVGNACPSNGGGAAGSALTNCTLVGNSAFLGGGAYDCLAQNSIVYYNIASNGIDHFASTLYNSCSSPDPGGSGNITNAPLFVDPGSGYGTNHMTGDYHLMSNSPCINTGTNEAWMADASDLDGVPRIVGPSVDMGSYEYPLTSSGIPGIWLREYDLPTDGTADLVDSDGDGMNNHGEYNSDTIPTNTESVLSFLAIGQQWGGTRLDWKGGSDAWQFLEVREDLANTNEEWTAIYGIPPPTPLTNAVVDMGATNGSLFYRIRAQR